MEPVITPIDIPQGSVSGDLQSCRYCPIGIGTYKVESDEGTYYVCEDHKKDYNL